MPVSSVVKKKDYLPGLLSTTYMVALILHRCVVNNEVKNLHITELVRYISLLFVFTKYASIIIMIVHDSIVNILLILYQLLGIVCHSHWCLSQIQPLGVFMQLTLSQCQKKLYCCIYVVFQVERIRWWISWKTVSCLLKL